MTVVVVVVVVVVVREVKYPSWMVILLIPFACQPLPVHPQLQVDRLCYTTSQGMYEQQDLYQHQFQYLHLFHYEQGCHAGEAIRL